MVLVNNKKLCAHILIKLEDGKFHGKTDLKKQLSQVFGLRWAQLREKDKLGRNLWDRDLVNALSWLRKKNLIENEVIRGKQIPARVKITEFGKQIFILCRTFQQI